MIAASKIRHEPRYDHLGKIFAERLRLAAENPGSFRVDRPARLSTVIVDRPMGRSVR